MNELLSFFQLIILYFTYQNDTILNFLKSEHQIIYYGQLPTMFLR